MRIAFLHSRGGVPCRPQHDVPSDPNGRLTASRHGFRGAAAGLGCENSDPSRPGIEVRENSWATGTNPAVDSVYTRIVAETSAFKGHNTNLSQEGATLRDLVSQAELVGPLLPRADLVLIQIMDNDIDCPNNDRRTCLSRTGFRGDRVSWFPSIK